MTDRKPALERFNLSLRGYPLESENGAYIYACHLPPAILNATKEELAALAVFAEAMPELLVNASDRAAAAMMTRRSLRDALRERLDIIMSSALAAAKSTTAEEAEP